MQTKECVVVIDFGSQITALICRRMREIGVYSEMADFSIQPHEMESKEYVKGIILSGGPCSVYSECSPHMRKDTWEYIKEKGIPVLGICYGMQEIAAMTGGCVTPSAEKESADTLVQIHVQGHPLFHGIESSTLFWMSHGDEVSVLSEEFQCLASSKNCKNVAFSSTKNQIYGVQFHPEVAHSVNGHLVLENFARRICSCSAQWNINDFGRIKSAEILDSLPSDSHVIAALSGGVDSTVAAALCHQIPRTKFHPFLIDSGFLRKGELEEVQNRLSKELGIQLNIIDYTKEFYEALRGVSEPEEKRKIFGNLYMRAFEAAVKSSMGHIDKEKCYLLQGTLYTDVIESSNFCGSNAPIKSHHNVGGLPLNMKMQILEPLKLLFKDEVRKLGLTLGLSSDTVNRHPSPGPGLLIRIIGDVTEERVETLRHADDIFVSVLKETGEYYKIAQAFCVLLPTIFSVGVMGDGRTYENVCVLRAVTTIDYMTAHWYCLPSEIISQVSSRITNEVRGINRVVYDVTSKPPSTIEWE